jgi:uncharacterized membrane protein (TIGR02234 family)
VTRRSYGVALAACLAGSGLALYAVTRTWSLLVTARPGLSDLRTVRTGADLEPWLIGLALVALAGTGALLATRGRLRQGLGVLLALTGAGVLAGAIIGRAGLDVGRAGAGGTLWPVACALGGAIITLGGLTAARHGHHWPSMSSRYERRPVPQPRTDPAAVPAPLATGALRRGAGSSATRGEDSADPADAAATPAPGGAVDTRAAWDALDRGDDPTDG